MPGQNIKGVGIDDDRAGSSEVKLQDQFGRLGILPDSRTDDYRLFCLDLVGDEWPVGKRQVLGTGWQWHGHCLDQERLKNRVEIMRHAEADQPGTAS